MEAILANLNITESTRANLSQVSQLSEKDRLAVLEAIMLGELNVTKEGLGFPAERKTGPRGPTAKVAPRLAALRRPDYCGAVSFYAREATCVSDAKRVIRDRLRGLSRQERRDVERVDEALDAALVDWHDAVGKSYNRALQEMGLLDEDIKEGLTVSATGSPGCR